MTTLRADLEVLAGFWATGGHATDTGEVVIISACSAELLRVLDEHRETPGASDAPPSEPGGYALVEQMGYRQVTGTVREIQFCGKPMLEVTDMTTGQVRLVGVDSLYQVTFMSRDLAERLTRTGAHSAAAIAAADAAEYEQAAHVNLAGADPFGAWADTDGELDL
ncbi:MAG: hypothetical protein ACRDVE_14495 [Actinocrinis sp.]